MAWRTLLALLILWFGLISLSAKAYSLPQNLNELSIRIEDRMRATDIVGLAVALVHADGVFWIRGFGWADKEATIPATQHTLFRAGSISKSLTGLIVLRLVETGEINLDARVGDLAPSLQYTNPWAATRPIRLSHLLEHTTGWDDFQFKDFRNFPEGVSLAKGLTDNPLSRTSRWYPGTYASYSNSGAAVIGHILERVTGVHFEALARRELFEPLRLRTATFSQTPAAMARIARSYNMRGHVIPPTRIWASPSGSLAISAHELAKIVRMYLRRGNIGTLPFLSSRSISRSELPSTTLAAQAGLRMGHGLANQPIKISGVEYRGHRGAIDGFTSVYAYRLDAPIGFTILSNSSHGVDEIINIVGEYIKSLHPPPPELKRQPVQDLSAFDGVYDLITPRHELLRIFTELAGAITVHSENSTLRISGGPIVGSRKYIPVGQARFAQIGASSASIVFFKGPSGRRELTLRGELSYRARHSHETILLSGVWLMFFAAIALTLGATFKAFTSCLERRGTIEWERWRVWGLPLAATTALATALGAVITGISTGDPIVHFGSSTIITLLIQRGLTAFVLFSVVGLAQALLAPNIRRPIRIPAMMTCLAFLCFSLYLAHHGLIGIEIWAYQPEIIGP